MTGRKHLVIMDDLYRPSQSWTIQYGPVQELTDEYLKAPLPHTTWAALFGKRSYEPGTVFSYERDTTGEFVMLPYRVDTADIVKAFEEAVAREGQIKKSRYMQGRA